MKKIGKIVLGGGCLMTIICIALMLICNQIVTPCLSHRAWHRVTLHPDILESSSPYNFIQEVRPGSLKQYSKYFASALGTLPFIMTNNNE